MDQPVQGGFVLEGPRRAKLPPLPPVRPNTAHPASLSPPGLPARTEAAAPKSGGGSLLSNDTPTAGRYFVATTVVALLLAALRSAAGHGRVG